MANPNAFISATSKSPSDASASFLDISSLPLKGIDDKDTNLGSPSASTAEQDHLTPAQLRKLSKIFDLTNENHIRWLKAEIATEARPENSDLTTYGQDQLFRLITVKTMFVKNWLSLPTFNRPFETYQFLRYIKELSQEDLARMYNPKILNLTISDGGIDMKITIERSEPLSPHCYVYQNRYVVTGVVLQHHHIGFNMMHSGRGMAWHSAFLWRGENFKWLTYGAKGDERVMDTPQSLGMKDGDIIDVHVDLNVEGPCPVCHFDVNWVGTLVHQ